MVEPPPVSDSKAEKVNALGRVRVRASAVGEALLELYKDQRSKMMMLVHNSNNITESSRCS